MEAEQSPREFIKDRGGPHAMARKLGREDPRPVAMWSTRNRIPRKAWPDIIDAYPEVTLDELRALEARGD